MNPEEFFTFLDAPFEAAPEEMTVGGYKVKGEVPAGARQGGSEGDQGGLPDPLEEIEEDEGEGSDR